MEKENIIKLFGVEISVSTNEKEVQHNSTPSECSPTPISDQRTLSLDYQEKRVLDHQNTNSVSVSATADPQNNHVLITRKPPAAKKRAFEEIHDFNYNIKGGNNLLPFKKRFSATIFLAQVGDQNVFSSRNMKDDPSYASSSTCDDGILDGSNLVYCPMPLRCVTSELGFSTKKPCQEKKKAKKEKSIPPILPLEEIPGLMERIGSQNGSTKPVFLYKKKLQESDVKPHLNRLFIPAGTCKVELMGFLSNEEKAAITSETSRGLQFLGMDKNGRFYNLRLAKWDSLRMTVINKEWTTMVKANNVQKGDWVELWGYRVYNNELRLVVNFRKSETGNADGSSSSSTSIGGIIAL